LLLSVAPSVVSTTRDSEIARQQRATCARAKYSFFLGNDAKSGAWVNK